MRMFRKEVLEEKVTSMSCSFRIFLMGLEREGAIGLSVVLRRAVKTADLVDGVGRQRGRRGGLRLGEDVPKRGVGGEGDVNVVVVQDLLDGFGEGGMEGKECLEGGSGSGLSVEGGKG